MATRDTTRTPGTWRVADGAAVPFGVAKAAWALAARDVLIGTAKTYHGYITYGALAEEIQQISGVRTRSQMRNWIGAVLGVVAEESHAKDEPPLTALCVHQDETVGPGYAYVVQLANKEVPEDLDQIAAEARWECYRFFGAPLPSDGGHPALTPKVQAARKRLANERSEPPVCPSCFTQLPASGQCDNCT
jgi:hypothetical protein